MVFYCLLNYSATESLRIGYIVHANETYTIICGSLVGCSDHTQNFILFGNHLIPEIRPNAFA